MTKKMSLKIKNLFIDILSRILERNINHNLKLAIY